MPTGWKAFLVTKPARDGSRATAAQGRAAIVGRQDPDPDWQPI